MCYILVYTLNIVLKISQHKKARSYPNKLSARQNILKTCSIAVVKKLNNSMKTIDCMEKKNICPRLLDTNTMKESIETDVILWYNKNINLSYRYLQKYQFF